MADETYPASCTAAMASEMSGTAVRFRPIESTDCSAWSAASSPPPSLATGSAGAFFPFISTVTAWSAKIKILNRMYETRFVVEHDAT